MPKIFINGFPALNDPRALALRAKIDAALMKHKIGRMCSTRIVASADKKCSERTPSGPSLDIRALKKKDRKQVRKILKEAGIGLPTTLIASEDYFGAEDMRPSTRKRGKKK